MSTDLIYLDYNATTPVLPEVVDAMLPYLQQHFGNPSSAHALGRRAHAGVDAARVQVAALLGCDADEILFTSGGTESNNLAVQGLASIAARPRVVTSTIEHPSIAAPLQRMESRGVPVVRMAVDVDGRIQPNAYAAAIDETVALVTIMHANNETGVLQPVADIAAAARRAGALMHTDAAQSVGKVSVDVRRLQVDLLTLAGHKLYAPKGVGALYVRRGVRPAPLMLGAGHEGGIRPGTENVASIVGLGVACDVARRDLMSECLRIVAMRDRLWEGLRAAIPGLQLTGQSVERLPNTLNVRFPGYNGSTILQAAPEIAASAGSACHAGNDAPSAVLIAMGIPVEDARGAVRLSLGRGTVENDIDRTIKALLRAWKIVSKIP